MPSVAGAFGEKTTTGVAIIEKKHFNNILTAFLKFLTLIFYIHDLI